MNYMYIFSYGDGVHLRIAPNLETATTYKTVENESYQLQNIDEIHNIVMYKRIKNGHKIST